MLLQAPTTQSELVYLSSTRTHFVRRQKRRFDLKILEWIASYVGTKSPATVLLQ